MTPGLPFWRWAEASHEQALANARAAATACSRARVERAEVEQFLAAQAEPSAASAAAPPVREAARAR